MALLDFLKPRWSSGTMTEDDRRMIFWYLKRKTSYTSWKRVADCYSAFIDILEKQVREEPIVIDFWNDKIEWESVYTRALKGVVLYENGLLRLSRGDKTVLLYNDLGELRDAWSISGEWHSEIVFGGHEMDPNRWKGKYLTEMQQALRYYFLAVNDAGYVQPRMANLSAVETWYVERRDEFKKLPFPKSFPEVPEATEITVRTDEPTPVFGIYEPQVKDGCMNYMLRGVPARSYSRTPVSRNGDPVVWRLIWEDHRYEDGTIPEEEAGYFPPEYEARQRVKVLAEIEDAKPENQLVVAVSGEMAPQAGRWLLAGDLNTSIEIALKGDKMPMRNDRDVTWIWAASPTKKIDAYVASL